MGLGIDLILLLVFGLLFLGPKQMHSVLKDVARMKAQFDRARQNLKQQLTGLSETESPEAIPQSIERPSTSFSKAAEVRGQWL